MARLPARERQLLFEVLLGLIFIILLAITLLILE